MTISNPPTRYARINNMAKTQKHTHKLRRHRYKSGNVVYFCALPDCNYKIATGLALGKRVVCWRCGDEFLMNEYSIRLAKPHCENCHKPKVQEVGESEIMAPELHFPIIQYDIPSEEIISSLPLEEREEINETPINPPKDSALDLRSKLQHMNSSLAAKADDEGEI